jgi:hypothetical protein
LATSPTFAASSADARTQLRDSGCQTLAQRVTAIPGSGPIWLASYEPAPGGEPLPAPLRQSAFVYDNALAGIALIACGQRDAARRIADGVLAGMSRDRHYHDGRLRNAYRAGAIPNGPVPLPGWWDDASKRWFEDRYQVGTATGNVVWAALLLLATYEATRAPAYLDGAKALMGWVDKETFNADSPAAYIGGYFGHEPNPERQGGNLPSTTSMPMPRSAGWPDTAMIRAGTRARSGAALRRVCGSRARGASRSAPAMTAGR